ncbi:MAG TPA: glutamine--fructose-6-phosphate transaminase (isomerizing) [Candidatus Kapabacteria bacterium]|nr:glutamine--fructose-6-phosphate transaminase (isomerizing) [Candidatus Kapabacteria bacterium]
MCGIVAYIGKQEAKDILINGLKRLEYRGYDSAGISLYEGNELITIKKAGKVADLEKCIDKRVFTTNIGIAHTRWATHGVPNDTNAHPHWDNTGNITLVHNGIIENYSALKKKLSEDGFSFYSDTDTEVLAVFIGALYNKVKNMEEAVRLALSEIDGTFGIAVLSKYEQDKVIVARRGSPMVLGIGDDEYIAASDASAIIQHTRQVIYLSDNEMAILKKDNFYTKTIDNIATNNKIHLIEFDIEQIEKSGYEHFMLKEINEQPNTFHETLRGRLQAEKGNVRLGGLLPVADKLKNANRIIITACGTSWHSGLVGEYLIENLAHIPVEVEYASEFRYRNPILDKDDIVFAISQSGETADTLAAIKEAKRKSATTVGIVNVVGSTIARDTDAGVYIHAGPEIGVASTKAFTSQIAALLLISLSLGRMRNLSQVDGIKMANAMLKIPEQMQAILDHTERIQEIAKLYSKTTNCLYLGRGINFPVALEGALKLKEISYIHAEGYPAAEMKHGPIALIDENMPVVFVAPQDEIYNKIISNIEEVKARRGKVIVIATEGDKKIKDYADHVITIPKTMDILTPVLAVLPLQLLSYYIAVERGCNVDQPRNLAKSVTVE